MPQVTEKPRQVFLHCPNPVCPGMVQETVDGFEVETAFLFTDNGGDLPFVERSTSRGMVPAEFDTACRHCGANREISLTPRPNYQPLSGADPMGLVGAPQYDPHRPILEDNPELVELRKQVAALAARLERDDEAKAA
jgi:hypothetical protein